MMRYFRVATRNTLTGLLARIRGKSADDAETSMLVSPIVAAIRQREEEGQQTRLVELHQITSLTQPEALSALARLERQGMVEIEPNHTNSFESLVRLTKGARSHTVRDPGCKSA